MLTLNELSEEYFNWRARYGNGRNDKDLRFGQYLMNTYDITNPDVFYIESAEEVFNILSKEELIFKL